MTHFRCRRYSTDFLDHQAGGALGQRALFRAARLGRTADAGDGAGTESSVDGDARYKLPGARPHFGRDRTCDPTHLRLELRVDLDAQRIEGVCVTTLVPLLDGTRHVELDAVELDIEAVSLASGQPLQHSSSEGRLRIELGEERPAGQPFDVVVRYRTRPRKGLYFIEPDAAYPDRPRQVWSQGQDEDARRWFPCIDIPGVKSTSELIVTVPADFTALSNGRLIDETSDPERRTRTFHWRQEVPHAAYLVTLVVGQYDELHETVDGIALDYYVPRGRKADGRRTFGRTAEMIRHFGERVGLPYPYARYGQVVVAEFIFGGMENTSQTTLTDEALYDERAALDHTSDPLIAHELSHQWFGDLLTCRDWTQGWLNEGFATYFEAVWREHHEGRDERDQGLQDDADAYFAEDRERYRRPVVTRTYHEPIDLFDRHLYEKGAWVLHMLRAELGEAPFWKAIRHYTRKHARQAVSTADLLEAIEETTGRNLEWFFEQWIHRGGAPELKAEVSYDDATRLLRVALSQTQKVDALTPLFRLPLEVRIVAQDGRRREEKAILERAEQAFFIPLDAPPADVQIDPRNVLLKQLTVEKPAAMWRTQLMHAEEAIARSRAAEALGKLADAVAVETLETALAADAFWGTRAACAKALGAVRSGRAARALVVRLAAEPHPKARRAIVRALGEWREERFAQEAVRDHFLRGDPSYFVEAECLRTLARQRAPFALEVIREGLRRPSYLEVIACYGLEGLGELRDPAGLPLALEHTAYGRPPRVRRAAVSALGRLADLSERRGEVVDELCRLLDDRDFRVRLAVADALEAAADPRAIGPLSRALARELDGRAKRRYREVIRALESGEARDQPLRRLREEVASLREEQAKLRERLLALEARLAPVKPTEPAQG